MYGLRIVNTFDQEWLVCALIYIDYTGMCIWKRYAVFKPFGLM